MRFIWANVALVAAFKSDTRACGKCENPFFSDRTKGVAQAPAVSTATAVKMITNKVLSFPAEHIPGELVTLSSCMYQCEISLLLSKTNHERVVKGKKESKGKNDHPEIKF